MRCGRRAHERARARDEAHTPSTQERERARVLTNQALLILRSVVHIPHARAERRDEVRVRVRRRVSRASPVQFSPVRSSRVESSSEWARAWLRRRRRLSTLTHRLARSINHRSIACARATSKQAATAPLRGCAAARLRGWWLWRLRAVAAQTLSRSSSACTCETRVWNGHSLNALHQGGVQRARWAGAPEAAHAA